jgi:AcrR family transcriptional regulator
VTGTSAARVRNARGEGARLRADVVRAARSLLERSGTEDAVTLRATAREAGIAAPSIYAHFADRRAMIEAVVSEAFAEFTTTVIGALRGVTDPAERLRAGCRAYVRFGHEHPATYAMLFTRHRPSELPTVGTDAARVFQVLVDAIADCASAGRSPSADPRRDAVALWLGLHGMAALPPAHPRFPWPETESLLDDLIARLVPIR